MDRYINLLHYELYDIECALKISMSDKNLFREIPYYMALEFLEDTNFSIPRKRGRKFEGGFRERMILESAPCDRDFVLYNRNEVRRALSCHSTIRASTTVSWQDSVLYWAAERVEKLCDLDKEKTIDENFRNR